MANAESFPRGLLITAIVLPLFWSGLLDVFDANSFLGRTTRDLFDHIALLDQWSISISEWNFPTGGRLVPPDIFGMLLAQPWLGLGRGVAWDLSLCSQMTLNLLAGGLLGHRFGNAWAGAAAIGFSPFLLEQVLSGEAETISVWPLVLMCWLLIDGRWKSAGVFGAITALGSWYYGAYAAIVATLMCGVKWRNFTSVVQMPLMMLVLLIAPALFYANELSSSQQMFRGPTMLTYISEQPRALAAFSGDPGAWLGGMAEDANHNDSLGWFLCVLAIAGARKMWVHSAEQRRVAMALLSATGLSLFFSLGPTLYLRKQAIWEWMPYDLLLYFPFLELMRLPHRWLVVATITIGALAAVGARRIGIVAFVLIAGESIVFNASAPVRTVLNTPAIVNDFDGPVLQLPLRTMEQDARGKYLVWQREHQQPVAVSILMQGWSQELTNIPLIIDVTIRDSLDPIGERPVEARQFRQEEFALEVSSWRVGSDVSESAERLRVLGFRQVCLHVDLLDPVDRQGIIESMVMALGFPDSEKEGGILWNL